MKYFEKLALPDFDLYPEVVNLLNSNKIDWNTTNQICINTTPDRPDDYVYGTGSLDLDWDNSYEYTDENGNKKIHIPPRNPPLSEEMFTEVVDVFKNTVFEDCVNELKKYYKLGRVRLMRLKPKSCLSWHYDYSPRIHLPLKTQEGCFMVIEDEILHLDEGTWWFTETTNKHTAFNGSKSDRIHLLVNVLDTTSSV